MGRSWFLSPYSFAKLRRILTRLGDEGLAVVPLRLWGGKGNEEGRIAISLVAESAPGAPDRRCGDPRPRGARGDARGAGLRGQARLSLDAGRFGADTCARRRHGQRQARAGQRWPADAQPRSEERLGEGDPWLQ